MVLVREEMVLLTQQERAGLYQLLHLPTAAAVVTAVARTVEPLVRVDFVKLTGLRKEKTQWHILQN
jgi:hypothetical protein